jgi:hypothetical protein
VVVLCGVLIERRLTAQEIAADLDVTPLAKHGEIGMGRNRGDNITSSVERGASAAYLVRKLKRDAPEFAEAAGPRRKSAALAWRRCWNCNLAFIVRTKWRTYQRRVPR